MNIMAIKSLMLDILQSKKLIVRRLNYKYQYSFNGIIKPVFLYLCCYCHNSDFYVLCAHSYRFIIIILYSCLSIIQKIKGVQAQNTLILNFTFTYVNTCLHWCFYFFLWFQAIGSCFHFSLKRSLQHLLQLGLLVSYSLSFCLSGNILISPSFLKNSFARYRVLSFSTLNMLSHCLLAYIVSDVKSVVNFIENPLYMMNCFSLAASRALCLLTI